MLETEHNLRKTQEALNEAFHALGADELRQANERRDFQHALDHIQALTEYLRVTLTNMHEYSEAEDALQSANNFLRSMT